MATPDYAAIPGHLLARVPQEALDAAREPLRKVFAEAGVNADPFADAVVMGLMRYQAKLRPQHGPDPEREAQDAAARVRALHRKCTDPERPWMTWCLTCGMTKGNYPCSTIAALDGDKT